MTSALKSRMRSPRASRSLHLDLLGDITCRAELCADALDLSSKQTHFNSLLRQTHLLSPLSQSSSQLGHPSPQGCVGSTGLPGTAAHHPAGLQGVLAARDGASVHGEIF